MVTREFAREFAREWVAAWCSHDLDAILRHYADDVVIVSPIAGRLLGDPEVRGKEAVERYFARGLEAYPDLRFTLLDVLCGERSLVVLYTNQNGVTAGELMELDDRGKVTRMLAHYDAL